MKTAKDLFLDGLVKLAERCKCELSDWDYDAYLSVFEPLGFDKGVTAIKHAFLSNSNGSRMPAPYDMLEFIGIKRPEAPKTRDEANDITANIVNAIAVFGGYKAIEAREHLGEHAWEVVEGFGGWESLCMTEIDQFPTIRAQMRDLSESKQKIAFHRENLALGQGSHSPEIQAMISGLLESKDLN